MQAPNANGTMTVEAPTPQKVSTAQSSCRHHWVIAGPDGPTSRGICKHCGAQRDFYNNPDAVVLAPAGAPPAG